MKLQNKRGFTLIELLVVITIIGILATGGVTVYTSQIAKARDTTRTSNIKAVQGGLEQYYSENSTYVALSVATNTGRTAEIYTKLAKFVGASAANDPTGPTSKLICLAANAAATVTTASSKCQGGYVTDANGLTPSSYKIYTNVEKVGNSQSDGGTAPASYEAFGGSAGQAIAVPASPASAVGTATVASSAALNN